MPVFVQKPLSAAVLVLASFLFFLHIWVFMVKKDWTKFRPGSSIAQDWKSFQETVDIVNTFLPALLENQKLS